MASDCGAEKNRNVDFPPLWKRLAKTASPPRSQESKHSPELADKKTIFRALCPAKSETLWGPTSDFAALRPGTLLQDHFAAGSAWPGYSVPGIRWDFVLSLPGYSRVDKSRLESDSQLHDDGQLAGSLDLSGQLKPRESWNPLPFSAEHAGSAFASITPHAASTKP